MPGTKAKFLPRAAIHVDPRHIVEKMLLVITVTLEQTRPVTDSCKHQYHSNVNE